MVLLQAYQILRHGGLPKENIVVMIADDIATSPANPHPNQIFNRPGGPDVYEGVPVVSQLFPIYNLSPVLSFETALSAAINRLYMPLLQLREHTHETLF